MRNAPEAPRKTAGKKTAMRTIGSWAVSLAIALAAALLINTFLFKLITVKGDSMLDTLETGDRLYVSLLSANLGGYERGDVVICRYPGRTDYCVKRLIALPGDTVMIDRGRTYVNGEAVEEDYLTRPAAYSCPQITLGAGEYFVLGDNRPVSHDSHSGDVGPVTDMVGKARCVFWPLSRWRGLTWRDDTERN